MGFWRTSPHRKVHTLSIEGLIWAAENHRISRNDKASGNDVQRSRRPRALSPQQTFTLCALDCCLCASIQKTATFLVLCPPHHLLSDVGYDSTHNLLCVDTPVPSMYFIYYTKFAYFVKSYIRFFALFGPAFWFNGGPKRWILTKFGVATHAPQEIPAGRTEGHALEPLFHLRKNDLPGIVQWAG